METITDITELVQMSLVDNVESQEVECDFIVTEDRVNYKVHAASIAYHDILLYTDKARLTYLVDKIGIDYSIELYEVSD